MMLFRVVAIAFFVFVLAATSVQGDNDDIPNIFEEGPSSFPQSTHHNETFSAPFNQTTNQIDKLNLTSLSNYSIATVSINDSATNQSISIDFESTNATALSTTKSTNVSVAVSTSTTTISTTLDSTMVESTISKPKISTSTIAKSSTTSKTTTSESVTSRSTSSMLPKSTTSTAMQIPSPLQQSAPTSNQDERVTTKASNNQGKVDDLGSSPSSYKSSFPSWAWFILGGIFAVVATLAVVGVVCWGKKRGGAKETKTTWWKRKRKTPVAIEDKETLRSMNSLRSEKSAEVDYESVRVKTSVRAQPSPSWRVQPSPKWP